MPAFHAAAPTDVAPGGAPKVWTQPLMNLLRPLFLKVLKDERDVPYLDVAVDAFIRVVPFALILLLWRDIPWWVALPVAPIYWFWATRGMARVMLMFHAAMHRPAFKWKGLDFLVIGLFPVFFGQTPYTFQLHHLAMHHREDNGWKDLSTTLYCQRDNFLWWALYCARFLFLAIPEFLIYFSRTRRWKWFRTILLGEGIWYLSVFGLMWWNWKATLIVAVLPVLVMRCLMMAGNFAQHAIVDTDDPEDPVKNSIVLLDSSHNTKCFNDGYHITHHLYPGMHWTELPASFEEQRLDLARRGAIAFRNIESYMGVWTYLMRHDYDGLAERFVHLGDGPEPSKAEIIALLKARVRRIPVWGTSTKEVSAVAAK